MKGEIRQAIEERVAVVKFGRDKRISENSSRTAVERRADLAQLVNIMEGGGTNGGDVTFERKIIIEDDSKVATGRNG